MFFLRSTVCGFAAVTFLICFTARADEAPDRAYGGAFDSKFQTHSSRPENGRHTVNLWNETNASGFVRAQEWLSFHDHAKYEKHEFNNTDNYYIDHDAALQSHGLTLRQLYGTVWFEPGSLFAGKIHPRFGSAFAETPGIFQNFASDYEQDERLGVGAAVNLPDWFGKSTLSAELFKLDTSVLSEAAFSRPSLGNNAARPGRFHRARGGAANTDDLSSYTLAVRGEDIAGLDGLKYQMSHTSEGVRVPGEQRERGSSVGASYEIEVTPEIAFKPFAELAVFHNLGGVTDQRDRYLTAAAALTWANWTLAPAYTSRRRSTPDVTNRDQQHGLSLIRELEFLEGLAVGVGYNRIRVTDRSTDSLGAMIGFRHEF